MTHNLSFILHQNVLHQKLKINQINTKNGRHSVEASLYSVSRADTQHEHVHNPID